MQMIPLTTTENSKKRKEIGIIYIRRQIHFDWSSAILNIFFLFIDDVQVIPLHKQLV